MSTFRPQTSDIVFVRYKNDIESLVKRFEADGYCVKVYEKHPDNIATAEYAVPKNKGNEASGFLKYILDHYHNLPEHVVFLHDHEFAWHQKGSIYDLVSECKGTRVGYKSLNKFIWNNETIEWIPELLDWYDEYLKPEMGSIHKYGDFMTGYEGCAQFIVHKKLILRRSFDFYQRLFEWLMQTELTDYYSGRHLEYTWHLMWEQVPVWNRIRQKTINLWCKLKRQPPVYNHLLTCIETHG